MTEKNTKYDQLIQAARDVEDILKTAKKTDHRISKRRPDIQRAGALWYLSIQRDLGVTLNHIYLLYNTNPKQTLIAAKQIREAIDVGARKWKERAEREDPGGPANE